MSPLWGFDTFLKQLLKTNTRRDASKLSRVVSPASDETEIDVHELSDEDVEAMLGKLLAEEDAGD